jgi:hypothetical protein
MNSWTEAFGVWEQTLSKPTLPKNRLNLFSPTGPTAGDTYDGEMRFQDPP